MKLSIQLLVPPLVLAAAAAFAHGDVAPQAVDTAGLPNLGEEWLEENPWRDPSGEYWQAAIDIGASGYNQNCARCHGLEVVSGGLAPDLRYLSADWDGINNSSNELLVNTLSMISPYGPAEKQALLEADDLKSRAEVLVALAEMELASGEGGSGSTLQ